MTENEEFGPDEMVRDRVEGVEGARRAEARPFVARRRRIKDNQEPDSEPPRLDSQETAA